jgi:HAD superfamily hydrolase (TIGR01490 family)
MRQRTIAQFVTATSSNRHDASSRAPASRSIEGMEAAFFDLDKTVIDRASIAAFGRPFMRGGLINRRLVARAAISQLIYLYFGADEERLVRVRESMLAITKGWDRAQVRQIVRHTLLETIEPIMYAEALELMELHRAAGHRVYLVSASPEEIVLPLADMLGVDGAICSRGEVDDQGCYTGRMAFYAYGEEKATAMRELAERTGIDLAASSAYSDSATDLPMLEAVGRPVAVNADRALAKVAKERGWEMRTFTKPVRLRDRVGRTSPVVTTGLAVAGAALILWRRNVRGHRPGSQAA